MANISGNNADNVLNGTAADDRIVGQGGNDTINGGDGNDFFLWNYGDGNDIIDGGNGRAVARFKGADGPGDNILIEDVVVGGNTFTRVCGDGFSPFANLLSNIERTVVSGEGGDDTLNGQTGDDVMTGGAGNDVFVFTPIFNRDIVTDFEDGSDHLRFFKAGVADITDLTISDLNRDLLVSVTAAPHNDVLLLGQAGLALDAGDFIFFP
jgi:Ca2+-binding RTX toxin-like protein